MTPKKVLEKLTFWKIRLQFVFAIVFIVFACHLEKVSGNEGRDGIVFMWFLSNCCCRKLLL